jgi:nucleotide-binding universal stress UspA family protein
MIVSASYRTDIPAYYGRWFAGRLQAGFARVANPYGGPPSRVSLAHGDVDGVVLWTKNARPFEEGFAALVAARLPFVVQYSITGLPRTIERSAPASDAAVADLRRLSARHGRRAVVWRFDPVVVSAETPIAERRATFARLAAALDGAVDEAVVSFMEPYAKSRRNLAGVAWRDPEADEKRALVAELAGIAAEHGIRLTACSQPGYGAPAARCIDADRLSDVAGRPIAARTKGNRPDCLCAESRDIGAYDSCAMGCGYCYAVRDRKRAQARLASHDPAAECL